jgi:hypothetical protein
MTTEPLEPSEPRPSSRRTLAAALAGTAAAVALLPKRASADLSFGELRDALAPVISRLGQLLNLTREQLAFLRQVFAFISAFSLGAAWRLINAVLDLFDSTDETFMRSDRAAGSIERSYPDIYFATPREQAEQTLFRADSVKARCGQAAEVAATVAETNGELANEEADILAIAQASGSIAGLLQGILAMNAQIAARLGHLSAQQNAIVQLLIDQTMVDSDDRKIAIMASEEFRDGLGDVIAPPRTIQTE